jgi:hypothetical protein
MKKTEEPRVYFSITLKPHSLFELERLTVQSGRVVSAEKFEATYIPVVMGRLMRLLQSMLAGRS